jgi:hypothetical protein
MRASLLPTQILGPLGTLVQYKEAVSDSHGPVPPPSLCLMVSVSSNDPIYPTYIKAEPCLLDRMESPQRNVQPGLDRHAMAILRSSCKAGWTKPQVKSFKELASRLGLCSQLAAPKYALNEGRLTQYIYSHAFIAFCISSLAAANNIVPRLCGMDGSVGSLLSSSCVKVCGVSLLLHEL